MGVGVAVGLGVGGTRVAVGLGVGVGVRVLEFRNNSVAFFLLFIAIVNPGSNLIASS